MADGTTPRPGLMRRMATALLGVGDRGEVAISDTRRTSISVIGPSLYPYNPDRLANRKGGLRIYDEMRLDDQVKACLWLTKAAIIGPGWKLDPKGDSDGEKQLAETLTDDLQRLDPGTLDDALWEILSALDYGFSVSEKVYALDGRAQIRAVKAKAPHHIDFECDAFGNLVSIWQMQLGGRAYMDPAKFVVFQNAPEFGNYYGTSFMREAYKYYWYKTHWLQWWAIWGERLATPPIVANHPINASPEKVAATRKVLEKLQASTVFTVPEGWEVQLIQAAQQAPREVFSVTLDWLNLSIARAMLLPEKSGFAGGETKAGSFALSKSQIGVYFFVLSVLSRRLQSTVQRQLIDEMAAFEVASATPPGFQLLPLTEENKERIAELWISAVTNGVALNEVRDENRIRDMLGFGQREETPEERAARQAGQTPLGPGGTSTPDPEPDEDETPTQEKPTKPTPAGGPRIATEGERERALAHLALLVQAFREIQADALPPELSTRYEELDARIADHYRRAA